MSGMSLLSKATHYRKGTESTMSSSPPVEDGTGSTAKSFSAPVSPTMEKQQTHRKAAGPIPSPISKPSSVHHSHANTSSTSPSLTLTPNSTDGSNFLASPFHNSSAAIDAPSMPFLYNNNDGIHRRGESSSFGSFDLANHEDDNDGLFGLEALHYRAATQINTGGESPRMARSHYSAHPEGIPRRAGTDRPPLSQSYGEGSSLHNSERSVGGTSFNASMESTDLRGFGTIGQLRLNAMEFDPNRRRASSQDNVLYTAPPSNPFGYQQQEVSQKFGALPTLSSHIHQQKNSFADIPPKPRHIRSVSQPGPPGSTDAQQQQQQLPLESRFYSGSGYESNNNNSYNTSMGTTTRSASMSHQILNSSYDQQFSNNNRIGGASMPNLGYQQSGGYNNSAGYPPLERREALDFQLSPGSQSNGSYMGGLSTESYGGGPISISPGHSPHQIQYGAHVRQQSDNVISMSSQSMPMGLSSSLPRSLDDDLAHPLVGEHIEVPDHDDLHGLPSYFMQGGGSGGGSHPLLRGATHSHSMSLDAIPAQYMDHRPAAALPMPKIVYAVKFKRSQRNFVPGPRISRDLKIGTYVKVEADRGEDLGIVVGKLPAEKFSTFSARASFTAGMGPPAVGSPADLKRIIRLATHDEVSLLGMKREEEEELLKICRAKVRQRGLPMNVVDAEYQFDRHKLTFFFEAMGRVDFRELVRDLFSMYKTRIWMQQLDKNTSTSAQAIMAPLASSLQMDYGTPIIAPPSEFADSIVFQGMSGGDSNRSH
jgi:PSP1 C-terminal conserved region